MVNRGTPGLSEQRGCRGPRSGNERTGEHEKQQREQAGDRGDEGNRVGRTGRTQGTGESKYITLMMRR